MTALCGHSRARSLDALLGCDPAHENPQRNDDDAVTAHTIVMRRPAPEFVAVIEKIDFMEQRQTRVSNYFFLSAPRGFWGFASTPIEKLLNIVKNRMKERPVVTSEQDVLYTTGPDAFTETVFTGAYADTTSILPKVALLSTVQSNSVVNHHARGGWRSSVNGVGDGAGAYNAYNAGGAPAPAARPYSYSPNGNTYAAANANANTNTNTAGDTAAARHEPNYSLTPKRARHEYGAEAPSELQGLRGTCVSYVTTDGHYEYRVCPFDNVTQHDLKGTYNGILGVWGSWAAPADAEGGAGGDAAATAGGAAAVLQAGGTMQFGDGETCGHKGPRNASVHIACGSTLAVTASTEPQPCTYALELTTPLVCPPAPKLGEPNYALTAHRARAAYGEVTPAELRGLRGTCVSLVTSDGHYEYRVCPFDNVTQHDLKGTYNGVLGVWGSFNTVTLAMQFTDGETCGDKGPRKANVAMICGTTLAVTTSTEPEPCVYALELTTPLMCPLVT